ncbi:MAG: NUMOD3 domain-containing DNA-binding protein [archaeon]|nr:NUMOD3 domain-containing DNA-binding protein [archaeon]
MPFQKGHKCFRTKESYKLAGIKIAQNPNSQKTQFQKGSSGFKGKHTEETKKKIKEARARQEITPKHLEKLRVSNVGRVCLEETKRKIGNAQNGEKNHNWKGGITPLRIQIRYCFLYRQWQSDILQRDDFTCQICHSRGGVLATDHYPKAFSKIIREYKIGTLEEAANCLELWNLNNGRVLCKNCHSKTDNYGGKSKNK